MFCLLFESAMDVMCVVDGASGKKTKQTELWDRRFKREEECVGREGGTGITKALKKKN